MRHFSTTLVFAIVLLAVRSPLLWGHSHSGLDAVELARHLELFHADSGDGELPRGWHWHAFLPGLVAEERASQPPVHPVCSGNRLLECSTATGEVLGPATIRVQGQDLPSGAFVLSFARRRQRTFLVHNVLLI
jgi:hypothetical protein